MLCCVILRKNQFEFEEHLVHVASGVAVSQCKYVSTWHDRIPSQIVHVIDPRYAISRVGSELYSPDGAEGLGTAGPSLDGVEQLRWLPLIYGTILYSHRRILPRICPCWNSGQALAQVDKSVC